MQCPQCQQQVGDGEGFCWNCGARLQQGTAMPDATRVAGITPPSVAPPAPRAAASGAMPPAPAYDPSLYEETVAGPKAAPLSASPAAPSAGESTMPMSAAVPPPSMPPTTPPSAGGKKPKSNRGLLITLIVLVVIMLAAIGFWIWQSTRANDDAPPQEASSLQTAPADTEDTSSDDGGDADDKDDKDDDKKKDAKCTATPDVDVDDLTASGNSLIATLSLSAKSCETGSYAEPNVKITVKNGDGDVIAAAVYDFSKKPIDFEDGEASAQIAFNSRQHWQPADEITSPTNAKVVWQVNQKGEGNASGDVAGALGGASIAAVDNERYAQLALKRQLDDDSSLASPFYSDYTTQLSSKKYNMNIDGKAWKYTDIYEQFLKMHYKHSNAILIWAADYYNYTKNGHAADYYVILSGESFSRADDATAWCSANGYAAEDCIAVDLK